jgi:hypothetical protein
MDAKQAQEYIVDSLADFGLGMDSGREPISLQKTQIAFGLNTSVREKFIHHRNPYQIQNLVLDTGVNLTGARFQGACYYKPDFGAESIVAQIGGRLYQFIPDTTSNANVYDRTVRNYVNGSNFTSLVEAANVNLTYQAVLENLSDTSAATYAVGTKLITDPSYLSSMSTDTAVTYTINQGNTGSTAAVVCTVQFPGSYSVPINLVGSRVTIPYLAAGVTPSTLTFQWIVTAVTSTTITLSVTLNNPYTIQNFTIPAGTPVFTFTNPRQPQTLAFTSSPFKAPLVFATVYVNLSSAYPGSVGDVLTVGNGTYQVQQIINTPSNNKVTVLVPTPVNPEAFTYDANLAGTLQAWLWQSENFVIVNDGVSRPVIFNGLYSRRSLTPTFNGTTAGPFTVPKTGAPVTMTLSTAFQDAPGIFIAVSPLGLNPFQMLVTQTNVGGNSSVITAVNITGQSGFGFVVPLGTPIVSVSPPIYYGVLADDLIGSTAMPAVGSNVTLNVTPPYTGAVGSQITLTDGTGPLTAYTFIVTSILSGGLAVVATNNNAPQGLIINAGYPVLSSTQVAAELPIGRMGAYVQGRNWISLPNGRMFIGSDQVGDSSGSAALNYRDAVLKWSINTTQFSVPGGAGKINGITPLSAINAALGQGPLQVLTDNDVFSFTAPSDQTTWATTTNLSFVESAIGFGGVGQNASVVSNGDLIIRSTDGTIHSLLLAEQDFDQWGDYPISQEINRVISQENPNLYPYLTHGLANNRALLSCAPLYSNGVIFSQGLISLDFDVTSTLQAKGPSVYDGIWKDLNVLQIVTGKFNKQNRTFIFNANTSTNTVELWEVLKSGQFDNGTNPITWSFETPYVFSNLPNKRSLELIQLKGGSIWIQDLVGQAQISVWFRSDFDPYWHQWTSFSVCADNITSGAKQQRERLGLGRPPECDCDPTVNKFPDVGRFFQFRFEITGSLKFMAAEFQATPRPESALAPVAQNEGTPALPSDWTVYNG